MKFNFTDALHNHLVGLASTRIERFGLKGKKAVNEQHNIFVGAISAIDFINTGMDVTNRESCITPGVYLDIIRGNLIEKKEVSNG